MDNSSLTIAGLHQHLKDKLAAALVALGVEGVDVELAPAPNPKMGDLGFPCFPLAKILKKGPPIIAKDLATKIETDEVIAEVIPAGPYVNFRIHRAAWAQVVVGQVLGQKDAFGADQAQPKQNWMVEYSAPNTNKPLHLGHTRNNLVGASVAAILRHYGHRVTRINLVNDRGVHICKSMLAYKLWGRSTDPEQAGKKGDKLVGDFYVQFDRRFNEEYTAWQKTDAAKEKLASYRESPAGKGAIDAAQKEAKPKSAEEVFFAGYKDDYFNSDSELGGQTRDLLLAWEAEDPEVRELWRKLNDWVLAGFDETYKRMGVGFEFVQRESETYKLGKKLVEEGLQAGVLHKREDGAVACDLTKVELQGEKVLLRKDGTSLYMTQDLGTAVERFDQFELDKLVYVVGDEQIYHFDVLFRVLDLLRPGMREKCYHLAYGMIRLPEGKMKSREGTVVDADDLMDEMHRLAKEETAARAAEGKAHSEGIDAATIEDRAERIGMSALKYYLLKFTPKKSFEYDPKESIDFLGQTGPYCLFNYARTRSLIRKAGGEPAFDLQAVKRLESDRELELIRLIASFPEAVGRAVKGLDPSRIAEYCFDLCKSFAFIFTDKANHPIVTCEDPELRSARLMLATAVSTTLRVGLGFLGIEVFEEM